MKYFASDMFQYRKNLGSVPKNWVDSIFHDEKDIILDYLNNEIRVFDADTCGEKIIYFVFENNKVYKLYYDWYIKYEPEWDLIESFDIEEIKDKNKIEQLFKENKLVKNRDWLKI